MIGAAAALVVMVHGDPAAADHAVAVITPRRISSDDEPTQVLCTASLVSERTLLTAGHCVEDYGRGTLEVHFGSSVDEPAQARLVNDIVLHPEYDPTTSAFDLAVLWLDAAVPLAPLTLYPGTPDAEWIDRPLRTVGFASGERRTGTVAVGELDQDTITYLPAPDMTCRGDSGGPVLATVDGVEQVVGVTSAGDIACEAWGAAAQVDERVIEFLALAPDAPETVIEADAICAETCISDEQCPGDLLCTDEGQCTVRGLEAGDLVNDCTSDADCGSGLCVPMGSRAQCLEPCAGAPGGDLESVGGCRVAGVGGGARPSGGGSFMWMVVWAFAGLVRRRAGRTTGGIAVRAAGGCPGA